MASMMERESSFCDIELCNTIVRALHSQKQGSTFCDVIMKVCGREIYAHSNILAAASPYFNTFLSQDLPRQFSQRSPQVIEIQIDGSEPNTLYEEAVSNVIDFIYTGRMGVKQSNAAQITEIARIMQMDNVVKFCEDVFSGKVEDDSVMTRAPSIVTYKDSSVNTVLVGGLSHNHHVSVSEPVAYVAPKLKAGKLVSISTQVNPQVLGVEPRPKVTREVRCQTCEREFPEKPPRLGRRLSHGRGRRPYVSTRESHTSNDDPDWRVSEGQALHEQEEGNHDVKEPANETDQQESDCALEIDVTKEEKQEDEGENDVILCDSKEEGKIKDSDGDISVIVRRSPRKPKPSLKLQGAQKRKAAFLRRDEPKQPKKEPPPAEVKIQPRSSRGRPLKPSRKASMAEFDLNCKSPEVSDKSEDGNKHDGNKHDEAGEVREEVKETEEVPLEEEKEDTGQSREDFAVSIIEIKPNSKTRFKSRTSLRGRGRFLRVKKFTCDTCGFSTDKVREYSSHCKLHKLEQNICYYCEQKFNSRDVLNEHMEKHKGPQPFFCPVCEFRFKTRTQLNLHLPKHSTYKPFICEVCSAGFKWKHALKNHMIVHSNKKDHLCDVCGYATAHKSQLKAHRLIHTGQTYRCPFANCEFQATKRQNLKYHLLTHTREKPHQCEICGQSFSLVKNMRRHMLLHRSDKPHNCSQCEFCTTRFDKLKDHMLKQHGFGTPPEKRVRISDLVGQALGGSTLTSNITEQVADTFVDDEGNMKGLVQLQVGEDGVLTLAPVQYQDLQQEDTPVNIIPKIEEGVDATAQIVEDATDSSIALIPGQSLVVQAPSAGQESQGTDLQPVMEGSVGETIDVSQDEIVAQSQVGDQFQAVQYAEVMISQVEPYVQQVTFVSQ